MICEFCDDFFAYKNACKRCKICRKNSCKSCMNIHHIPKAKEIIAYKDPNIDINFAKRKAHTEIIRQLVIKNHGKEIPFCHICGDITCLKTIKTQMGLSVMCDDCLTGQINMFDSDDNEHKNEYNYTNEPDPEYLKELYKKL